ncbi:hypothetical protein [Rhizobium tumorigenes]|uniref:Uncharacterized protein n=1 Tax=Rhizobium tumorigenes TaxID=2041385 RepID=A0AAF1KSI3_9HYPH|nr:hypothetical protein [Rhizobium tumorigenes]WFR97568.1 hypothetical protein PR017_20395 [Rhizobium tumorigenes]WFS03170.1 hypothetical protein PR016_21140 [Rhizobium tumorigenes]
MLLSAWLCVFQGAALAKDGVMLHLGEGSPGLHVPVSKQDVFAVPAFEDYSYMLFDVCDAMGLTAEKGCDIYPMNASLGGNAIVTVQNGNKIVVYDRELSPKVGTTAR